MDFFSKLIADTYKKYLCTYLDLIRISNNDMSINTLNTIFVIVKGFQKLEEKLLIKKPQSLQTKATENSRNVEICQEKRFDVRTTRIFVTYLLYCSCPIKRLR